MAIRRWHLYLSCFFSPLLLYFVISGAWQTIRLNNLPKEGTPSMAERAFHELSKPHRYGTQPGNDPKGHRSLPFNIFALTMGLGIAVTALLGIALAWQMKKKRGLVFALLVGGALLPVVLLLF